MNKMVYEELDRIVVETLKTCTLQQLITIVLRRMEEVLPFWNDRFEGATLASLNCMFMEYADGNIVNQAFRLAKAFLERNGDGAMSTQEAKQLKALEQEFAFIDDPFKEFLDDAEGHELIIFYTVQLLLKTSVAWATNLEQTRNQLQTIVSKTFWAQNEKGEPVRVYLQNWKATLEK